MAIILKNSFVEIKSYLVCQLKNYVFFGKTTQKPDLLEIQSHINFSKYLKMKNRGEWGPARYRVQWDIVIKRKVGNSETLTCRHEYTIYHRAFTRASLKKLIIIK